MMLGAVAAVLVAGFVPIPGEQRFLEMHEQQMQQQAAEGDAAPEPTPAAANPPATPAEGVTPTPSDNQALEGANDKPGPVTGGGAEVGYGKIGEDTFATVTPWVSFLIDKLKLTLQVPLNIRLSDKPPKATDDYFGYVRKSDWDQASEFLNIVRYASFGVEGDDLYAKMGKLSTELGHGTIVNRYSNNLDINQARVGAQFAGRTSYGGVEVMVNDLGTIFGGSVQSRILGGRLYLKPLGLVAGDSPLNIFQLGFTLVSDINAPYALARDIEGVPVIEDGHYRLARKRAATVYGVDLGVELLRGKTFQLTPYTDLNAVAGGSFGYHVGVKLDTRLGGFTFPLRLEYRFANPGYFPGYFSPFYEIERFTFPLGTKTSLPKGYVARQKAGEGSGGVFADLAISLRKFQLGFIYEDYDADAANVAVYMAVPGEKFQFKAYYGRTDIDSFGDAFGFDARSMMILQSSLKVIPYTAFWAQWTRLWKLEDDASNRRFGRYVPEDVISGGVSLAL